jgi:hypothetical protein
MNSYLELLNRNYRSKDFFGGAEGQNLFVPDGGFPPIYECEKDNPSPKTQEGKKKREFVDQTKMSVSNILKDRRNTIPFFTIKRQTESKVNKLGRAKKRSTKKTINY